MKVRLVVLALIATLLPMGVAAGASTIHVPSQYSTIQAAIDAASPGDTVFVAPGVYAENLTIDKTIHLISEYGPQSTTIAAANADSTISMTLEAIESPTLSGFSITGGTALFGGGVKVYGGAPTITDNIVSGNLACNGGGLYLQATASLVQHNHIVENGPNGCTGGRGGGIYLGAQAASGAATIRKNVIEGNLSSVVGGILVNAAGPAVIDSNRIVGNDTQSSTGIGSLDVANYSPISFLNNIVDGNGGSRDVSLVISSSNPGITIAHNTFVGSASHGATIEMSYFSDSSRITSNIFANSTVGIDCPYEAGPTTIARVDHNLFTGAGGAGDCAGAENGDGNVLSNVFLDPNYQISGGSGSAIDAAATDTGVTSDYAEVTRIGVAPDMGALEWTGSTGDIIANAGPDQNFEWAPNVEVVLDASASSHPYGEFLYYAWNNTAFVTIAEGERAIATFPEPGVYEIDLVVTDTSSDFETDRVVITLTDPGPNQTPPTANAGPDVSTEVFVPVTLDGSSSFTDNPDATLVNWAWTGAFDNSPVFEVSPQVVFSEPGAYEVTLTVTDSLGLIDTDAVYVTVTAGADPSAHASLTNLGSGSKGATLFEVGATCTDASLVSAELNGIAVGDGQAVELKLKGGKERIRTMGGTLRIESSAFQLVVTCADGLGQQVTATATPDF